VVPRPFYVSISGGIAVGKTTLTGELSNAFPGSQSFIERPERNPYLADFYADMHRWAFHSRIAMLAMFASRYKQFDSDKALVLLDRCLNELITFANLHVDRGNMNARDFSIYQMLYQGFLALAPPLDIVVYLHCSPSVALQRIARRDRPFEREVSLGYLMEVEAYYEPWLAALPTTTTVLRYNTDDGVEPNRVREDIRGCLIK
jgi:deoxyadenosine/deoxycytidine kinase